MPETNGDRNPASPVTVGVVTPTLNAERYLERTLQSIWSQQGEGLQVRHVIVDGFSTDGTVEIAKRFPSEVVVAKDGGMYEAVNRGMAAVEGDIIGYINADDEIAPGRPPHRRPRAREPPGGPVGVRAAGVHRWRGPRPRRLDAGADDVALVRGHRLVLRPQQTVWVRRSFYERVGPYDTVFKNCADYDWYARAMRLSPPLILPQVIGRFRLHESNLSYDAAKMESESRQIQERYGGTGPAAYLQGKLLSLRLNARNPSWLVAKKTGKITFTPARD